MTNEEFAAESIKLVEKLTNMTDVELHENVKDIAHKLAGKAMENFDSDKSTYVTLSVAVALVAQMDQRFRAYSEIFAVARQASDNLSKAVADVTASHAAQTSGVKA